MFSLALVTLMLLLWIVSVVNSQPATSPPITCDCGFKDEGGNIWSNIWHADYHNSGNPSSLQNDKNYMVNDYKVLRNSSGYERVFSRDNVVLTPQSAQLFVRRNSQGTMASASVGTQHSDFLYGSFRASMKMPSQPGTVASFYLFQSDGAEIDMETLGRYTDPRQTYFTLHPQIYDADGTASNLTHIKQPLNYDPTSGFHEYRFDWFPGYVDFYLDGQLSSTLTTNVPTVPGRVIINHWTDGNPKFSGVAPIDEEMLLEVANLTIFFNSSANTEGPSCQISNNTCSVQDIMSRKLVPTNKVVPSSISASTQPRDFFSFTSISIASLLSLSFLLE